MDCRWGVGALLAAARRLRVGECTVCGVRWLLGIGRRWGKHLSSVVVYLDRPVVVRGSSVWFLGVVRWGSPPGAALCVWSVMAGSVFGLVCRTGVWLILSFLLFVFPFARVGHTDPPLRVFSMLRGPRRAFALDAGADGL